MLRLLLLSMALVVGTVVRAQRQITVLHSDTDEPIMGVTVRVGDTVLKTDRHGRVTIPEQFDSISFSHVEFVHECLRPSELTDPMYLFPRSHQLKEVTVAGIGPDLRRSLEKAKERWLNDPHRSSLLSFDLGNLFDRRNRRDRKQMKRILEVFKEFDAKQ
ncbi:MAG: hypothetical protein SPK85_08590 [Prevotella sp.]|nr:hypothetical protein [Prevotella sp.]